MTDKIFRLVDEAVDVPDPRPPEFSDDALALRFADQHAADLRYVAAWGQWLSWDRLRWRMDKTLYAFDRARANCREAAVELILRNKAVAAKSLASAKTVAAVITLARADRRIAATVDQWDADPWLLNTLGGIVDLRSGEIRPARPEDYMTKITSVAPDSKCPIPIWLAFLDRVTGSDAELIAFLQRMAGYILTGSTQEHALFFNYGTGANGKTTFINALTSIIGDYHKTAPIETFIASHTDHHPTDLAGLHGARLVTSVETEEGRRWADSKIKALTGGDKISARFMRQDFFEFTPAFKLLIAGNHKPGLRSVDEAIRRRLYLILWSVVIPADERDKELGDRLRAEWPGILQWMIDGCLEWQRNGLKPPRVVTDATEKYLTNEDVIEAWIEDCCDRGTENFEAKKKLFASWRAWAERAEEFVGSSKRFYQAIEAKGFDDHKRVGTWGFLGLKLKPSPDEEGSLPF